MARHDAEALMNLLSRIFVPRITLLIILPAQVAHPSFAIADSSHETPRHVEHNCGTLSLYLLLKLEQRNVSLDAVQRQLGAPGSQGHSLKALQDAASAFGLDLDGVQLHRTDDFQYGPILSYSNKPPHGHYVLVRAVGTSGKLVQVLDGFRAPEVIDYIDLIGRSDWTGMALVPRRRTLTGHVSWILMGLGSVVLSVTVVFWAVKLGRGAIPTR
jgi:hypothetical protein